MSEIPPRASRRPRRRTGLLINETRTNARSWPSKVHALLAKFPAQSSNRICDETRPRLSGSQRSRAPRPFTLNLSSLSPDRFGCARALRSWSKTIVQTQTTVKNRPLKEPRFIRKSFVLLKAAPNCTEPQANGEDDPTANDHLHNRFRQRRSHVAESEVGDRNQFDDHHCISKIERHVNVAD